MAVRLFSNCNLPFAEHQEGGATADWAAPKFTASLPGSALAAAWLTMDVDCRLCGGLIFTASNYDDTEFQAIAGFTGFPDPPTYYIPPGGDLVIEEIPEVGELFVQVSSARDSGPAENVTVEIRKF